MSPKELVGVVVYGSERVGKTSLITKYIDGSFNKDDYSQSVGIQMYKKRGVRFQVTSASNEKSSEPETGSTTDIDPGGRQLQSHTDVDIVILEATDTGCIYARRDWVYIKMSVIILAYSTTDPRTLANARSVLERARELQSKAKIFLVGLLADCEEKRAVSFSQGQEVAAEFEVDFRELSAAVDGDRVNGLFADVAPFLVLRDKSVKRTSAADLSVWRKIWKAVMPWSSS
ncbi:hypothetical protein BJY01DRAFT_27509 [Aspergillus pseudoustus]|uniref:P-loop containing nucleoside triphosphate hydrolase protein n=1 Tax=Aspergillus pseudoustus TaxID=1810923 RepID=A0ABR4JHS6_9EURO